WCWGRACSSVGFNFVFAFPGGCREGHRDFFFTRHVRHLQKRFDERQDAGGAVTEVGARAGDQNDAAQRRATRVLEVEGGVEVVVEPGQVEEDALLRALRLVGEL